MGPVQAWVVLEDEGSAWCLHWIHVTVPPPDVWERVAGLDGG